MTVFTVVHRNRESQSVQVTVFTFHRNHEPQRQCSHLKALLLGVRKGPMLMVGIHTSSILLLIDIRVGGARAGELRSAERASPRHTLPQP